MKRAILVLGPESSGTRLITRLLIQMGAHGEGDHVQTFDTHPPDGSVWPIVWRRSAPHAGVWPDVAAMAQQLRGVGYTVDALVMVRAQWPALNSQIGQGHAETLTQAETQFNAAYQHLFYHIRLAALPLTLVTFEQLIHNQGETIFWLAARLGLTGVGTFERVRDENEKYW